jgi:phosphoribosylformimino-5-aminoimidazole carboxamide ribotide isomerase
MMAYAALDLRGGRVVQLVGGRPEAERVSLPDPVAVALRWCSAGFRALHVVDLDAALGSGSNAGAVSAISAAVDVPVQVGGGVRDEAAVASLLDAGAARVVIGTRAVEDRDWLAEVAGRWPGRIVVAADARGGSIVTRGWTVDAGIEARNFVAGLDALPLGGVLVTDVGREGSMRGVDEAAFRTLAAATRHPLIASGGVGGAADLERLDRCGVAGVVLGMALYTGALDASATAERYAA